MVSIIHGPRYAAFPHVFVHTWVLDHAEVLHAVGAAVEHAHHRAGTAAADRVGTGVVEVLHVGTDDDPVGVDGQRGLHPLDSRVGRRDQVLATVLAPLHGRVEQVGGEDDDHLFTTYERLQTEAAADVADLHPDLVLGDAGDAREREPRLVGVLARHPHVEPLVERLPAGDDTAALHRHRAVAVLHEGLGDLVRGAGLQLLCLRAQRHRHLHGDVARPVRVHQVLGVGDREVPVEDGRERVVVDLDELGGVLGEVAALGDDQHDRVAHEADVGIGEREHRGHEVVGTLEHRRQHRTGDLGVELGAGVDGHHTLGLAGGGDVEAGDAGPGEVAAQEVGVEHVGEHDVVGVATSAGEEARVFLAEDRLPHESTCGRSGGDVSHGW